MIFVENVTKTFAKFKVLDEICLHVPKGSIYGLVGPNGAGKTTVIQHITGVLKPNSGSVKIGGEPIYDNAKRKQTLLSIADDWFYYGTFNMKEMARFYKNIYANFDMARYSAIQEVLKLDEKRQIRRFSKGMKKQAAFCLALAAKPEVLVLDEPLDGLDPVMRKQILNMVIADVADRGMTVLVSSHNLRELEDILDYVGIIHQGKLVMEKPLDDLKGTVHKYQLVLDDAGKAQVEQMPQVLHMEKNGAVYNVIARGDAEALENELHRLSPVLCAHIGLTLEEIFIYELGGLGYDFQNILV